MKQKPSRKTECANRRSVQPVCYAASNAEHCPKCDWPGIYIRTRYFETMTADVWMCDNEKCPSYLLYWHKDKPHNAQADRPAGRNSKIV